MKLETGIQRRERHLRNKDLRGGRKRLRNNRSGQPHRDEIQKFNADLHYKRLIKLGRMS